MQVEEMFRQAYRAGGRDVGVALWGRVNEVTFAGPEGVADRFDIHPWQGEAFAAWLASRCDAGWTLPARHGRVSDLAGIGLPPEVGAIRYTTTGTGERPWASVERYVLARFLTRSLRH